jgi:LemA protein
MLFFGLFFGFIILCGLVFVGIYNGLIGKRNRVNESLSSVDVMLKKRYDLIPNLVGAVDRYMEHEQGLLRELTELRARAVSGSPTDAERAELDQATSAALGQLMIAVENYPDLKANENFLQLQSALNEVEEQLSASRRAYNATVTAFNDAIEMFPSNVVAGMMGLAKRPWFKAEEAVHTTPDVAELFDR